MSNKINESTNPGAEAGFSLVEAVVAIFILTIGLIGTAGAITYALEFSSLSQNVTKAKLIAVASIEEIETLRNSKRLEFKQIANAGSIDNTGSPISFNGFETAFSPVSFSPGPDGVNGTADDLKDPGPDKIYGTIDDFVNPALARSGFTRRIAITNLSATLKKIEIKVRYTGRAGKLGELTAVSYLNNETRFNQ